jgi:hypothetical protein
VDHIEHSIGMLRLGYRAGHSAKRALDCLVPGRQALFVRTQADSALVY